MGKVSQRAVTHIYGYRKLHSAIKRGTKKLLKKITKEIEDVVLNIDPSTVQFSEDRFKTTFPDKFAKSFEERVINLTIYDQIFEILSRYDDEIAFILIPFLIQAYELGTRNAQRALIEAIANTSLENKTPVINAIREQEGDIDYATRVILEDQVEEYKEDYKRRLSRQVSNVIGGILVLKTLSDIGKQDRIARELAKMISRNVAGITTASKIIADQAVVAQNRYLEESGVEYVQWVVDAPKDTPCIVAANEIIRVGETFSNGLASPPVHPFCKCLLIPARINKDSLIKIAVQLGIAATLFS